MNKNNKTPMSKAKKEFIASIIWMIAGAIFIAAGGVMMSINKIGERIGGVVMACCGCAILGISIYSLIQNKKNLKQEKAH